MKNVKQSRLNLSNSFYSRGLNKYEIASLRKTLGMNKPQHNSKSRSRKMKDRSPILNKSSLSLISKQKKSRTHNERTLIDRPSPSPFKKSRLRERENCFVQSGMSLNRTPETTVNSFQKRRSSQNVAMNKKSSRHQKLRQKKVAIAGFTSKDNSRTMRASGALEGHINKMSVSNLQSKENQPYLMGYRRKSSLIDSNIPNNNRKKRSSNSPFTKGRGSEPVLLSSQNSLKEGAKPLYQQAKQKSSLRVNQDIKKTMKKGLVSSQQGGALVGGTLRRKSRFIKEQTNHEYLDTSYNISHIFSRANIMDHSATANPLFKEGHSHIRSRINLHESGNEKKSPIRNSKPSSISRKRNSNNNSSLRSRKRGVFTQSSTSVIDYPCTPFNMRKKSQKSSRKKKSQTSIIYENGEGSRMSRKSSIIDRRSDSNLLENVDMNDIQFLFNKKLTNADKVSILKLKSKKKSSIIGGSQRRKRAANTLNSHSSTLLIDSTPKNQQRSILKQKSKKTSKVQSKQRGNPYPSSRSSNYKKSSRTAEGSVDRSIKRNNPEKNVYSRKGSTQHSRRKYSKSGAYSRSEVSVLVDNKNSQAKNKTPRRSKDPYLKYLHSRRMSKDSAIEEALNGKISQKNINDISQKRISTSKQLRIEVSNQQSPSPAPQKSNKVAKCPKASSKTKYFEERFKNKRGSLPMRNKATPMADELEMDINMDKITMTPDFSRRGSSSSSNGSNLLSKNESSNSKLILNTLVSEATKTEDQYSNSSDFERQNLVSYIRTYTERNGIAPKTSLQFYKVLKMIGKGSFGKVHLGLHILSSKKVAIKCIDKAYIKEEKAQRKIVQEVKILRSLTHQNIIKILEVFENKKFVFIVTDYASQGDLLKYMRENGVFRESRAKSIAAQMLSGLEYCHAKRVLHRDVKLDNILVTKQMTVKLCDFGVSRFMTPGELVKERCGTPAYIAPEIINKKGYKYFGADVWSLGVLLYALTTGTIPFKADNIPELHHLILTDGFSFPDNVRLSSSFKDLIRQMLVKEPRERINIDSIWKHRWLKEFGHLRGKHLPQKNATSSDCLNDKVLNKLLKFGYSMASIRETINQEKMNHISATMFLLSLEEEDHFSQIFDHKIARVGLLRQLIQDSNQEEYWRCFSSDVPEFCQPSMEN